MKLWPSQSESIWKRCYDVLSNLQFQISLLPDTATNKIGADDLPITGNSVKKSVCGRAPSPPQEILHEVADNHRGRGLTSIAHGIVGRTKQTLCTPELQRPKTAFRTTECTYLRNQVCAVPAMRAAHNSRCRNGARAWSGLLLCAMQVRVIPTRPSCKCLTN